MTYYLDIIAHAVVVSLLHGNSSNMERQDWRCEVILRYDNRGPERLMYTSSQSRQKNGNAQYEDHIEFIQMKSHGGRVCKDIRIFDEDEGCGVYEDSVVFGADGNGNQAARKLPWDLLHDSACFNVQVYPKPPPPPKPAAPAAPAPLPPLPPSSEITQKNGDVVTINTPRSMVGVRVGSCMCPDGKMYEVGDANKGKGDCAPACYGGISKKDQ